MSAASENSGLAELQGQVAVVTGANSGLGLAISRALVGRGVHIVMACRNLASAASARDTFRTEVPAGTSVELAQCDLASIESVERAIGQIGDWHNQVDLLINNAGVMAVDAGRTSDGFETQLGVNYLGHFVLTSGLLPLLQRSPTARIATAASNGHRLGKLDLDDPMFESRPYGRWAAYFQSKLALQMFSLELARRLSASSSSVLSVSANPGAARTELGWEGRSAANRINRLMSRTFPPTSIASRPMLRALFDPGAGQGDLFGPRLRVLGAPVREKPSKRARDTEVAEKFWQLSTELTGHDPQLPPQPTRSSPDSGSPRDGGT